MILVTTINNHLLYFLMFFFCSALHYIFQQLNFSHITFVEIFPPVEIKKRKSRKSLEEGHTDDVPKTSEDTRRPLFLPLPYEHKMYNLMLHSPGGEKFGINSLVSPFSYHSFRYPELCSPTSPVTPIIPSPTPILDPGFPSRTSSNPLTPRKDPTDSVNNFIKPSISLLKVSNQKLNDFI